MWSESVLLFLIGEGNVMHPDFRCDLKNESRKEGWCEHLCSRRQSCANQFRPPLSSPAAPLLHKVVFGFVGYVF